MEKILEEQLICKQCNATLDPHTAVDGVIECEYCHNKYTVSVSANKEVREFLRIGERALDNCKFDDAKTAFLKASELNEKESEAYFGMALAEYKVQYLKDFRVKDDGERYRLQPICHEISESKFGDNANYKKALQLATPSQLVEYQQKAGEIDHIRSEFFKLKKSGLDYDCFICVKVTDDATGERTKDYKDADDIYFALKGKGYRPFFSERELSGFTGADYEARILYALYMSECMLVVCSREEYLNTPWVKNEYTRFIGMINDEKKESDSISIVFRGTPIERLPGKPGKLQGVNLSALDAMDRITGFVDTYFAENGKPAEIVRRDYGKSRAVRKTVQRTGVTKRELKIVGASEVTVSDKSKLTVAEGFLKRHEYSEAKSWCEGIIRDNPSLAEAYWLHFLAENECENEDAFYKLSQVKSNFEYFEKAISATADKAERLKKYDLLVMRVKKLYDVKCYGEYIQLPESDDKTIEELTDHFFDYIKKQLPTASLVHDGRMIFDEIIKTVKDADKYVRMNLEFARLVGDVQSIIYYKNILEVDNGHSEALYHVFADTHKDVYAFCAEPTNWQTVTDELYAYGFNQYATDRLFMLCLINIEEKTDKSVDLFDFLLPMIPKNKDKLFLQLLHEFIEKLFEIRQMKRAQKYNDLCLALDRFDHSAYFNRLIISKGFTNPLAVVTLAERLMEEQDFYAAVNSYAEKYPRNSNLYLDINTEMRKLKTRLGSNASKASDLIYVPCAQLKQCFDIVMEAMATEADRILQEICSSYGCSYSAELFLLRVDMSNDERLKTALEYAQGISDLEELIARIINTQGECARENKEQRAKIHARNIRNKILINFPGIFLIIAGVFLLFKSPFALYAENDGLAFSIIVLFALGWTATLIVSIILAVKQRYYHASVLISGVLLAIGLFVLSFIYSMF